MNERRLRLLLGSNLLAIVFFWLLYHTDNPRPYTNMLYFLLMGMLACWLLEQESLASPLAWVRGKTVLGDIVLGSFLMLVFYLLTLAGYHAARAGLVPFGGQGENWVFFTAAWKRINPLLSLAGIVLVVVALELFYRSYVLEVLGAWLGENQGLLLCSLLSALRGFCSGGIVSGGYDFALSWIWGWIYLRAGLAAAIAVHLVWDILFVYLSPG